MNCNDNNYDNSSNSAIDSFGGNNSQSEDEEYSDPLESSIKEIDEEQDKLKNDIPSEDNEKANIDMSISEIALLPDNDSANSINGIFSSKDVCKELNLDDKDLSPLPLDPRRRTRILDRPNQSLNLWSFLKKCIGKELTKIPMPVNFNEPLSMLQRLTEDFEYAHLLHKAATIEDSCNQLVLIAAFCVSSYSTTNVRLNKPFNPLLGETYECDRTSDLGWKSIAEQVKFYLLLIYHSFNHIFLCINV